MVEPGSIPISSEEATALVDIRIHDKVVAYTRRDPGDTGPLLVYTETKTYLVEGEKVSEV